jgi:RNA polymerase sporulation-specific sigma factor
LLARIRSGDEIAFHALTETYASLIDSVAVSTAEYLGRSGIASPESAVDDLRQEARLALYRASLHYDTDGVGEKVTFGLFAKICMRNALTSEYRRLSAKKRRSDRLRRSSVDESNLIADDVSDSAMRNALEDILRSGNGELSHYEENVLRAYAEGKKIPAIAEELGRSIRSVNNALYRIRVKLRR